MEEILLNFGLLIVLAATFAIIARLLKQPIILAYIATGLAIGPFGSLLAPYIEMFLHLDITLLDVHDGGQFLDTISLLGIIFLLFLVGLELNLKELKDIGPRLLYTGLLQMILTFGLGYGFCWLIGYTSVQSLLVSIALIFSSTIIVVQILASKGTLDSLYGKIALGTLLLQDFLAIFVLIVLSGYQNDGAISLHGLGIVGIKVVGLLAVSWILSKFVFSWVYYNLAKSRELLFLVGIAHMFIFVLFSHVLGISLEIGAFLGGITLAPLPYHHDIAGKIKPLRDLFITIFFVLLGLRIDLTVIAENWGQILNLTIFVILLKPMISLLSSSVSGFSRRDSFFYGLSLAQVSEFSIIVLTVAWKVGIIDAVTLMVITAVQILSIVFTSYATQMQQYLYEKAEPLVKYLHNNKSFYSLQNIKGKPMEHHVVLCGYHRTGYDILEAIKKSGKEPLVVDINPRIIKNLMKENIPCMFGDVGDDEVLDQVGLDRADIIISTVPDYEDNQNLMYVAKEKGSQAVIILLANEIDEALNLYSLGADYVILPKFIGGTHTSLLMEDLTSEDISRFLKIRNGHIEELKKKKKSEKHFLKEFGLH